MLLGIDIGSITVKVVLLDQDYTLLDQFYARSRGEPFSTIIEILDELFSRFDSEKVTALGTTGSGGLLVADLLNGNHFNELIAQTETVRRRYPQTRTVIELGGQDSKLLLLERGENRLELRDFALNNQCSAGTGSFLDQQAERLDLTLSEFSQLALKSEDPPRIAGRCSVFAKSDIIHLQQVGTSTSDIVNGLCYAVARNFLSSVAQGKTLQSPVLFQGGVSRNPGMVKAFRDVLELEDGELTIPDHEVLMSAIGAAILADDDDETLSLSWPTKREELRVEAQSKEKVKSRPPLEINSKPERELHGNERPSELSSLSESGEVDHKRIVHLGIDVGSISTNLVAVNHEKRLIAKVYLKTAGKPIDAVQRGLNKIEKELGTNFEVQNLCVTGSGREMIASLLETPLTKNEITAQATAATLIDSEVDTVFEIGGQDSKYISLRNGSISDFSMNKACAAGTGSFLEEQAQRLGFEISEFGDIALSSPSAVDLGERCTVFMESDLIHYQQRGANKEELVAGLAYSIAINYLNRVVGKKHIGEKVFFQGGVASNEAVLASFRNLLEDKSIVVPPHHEVTGAYGAAVLACEHEAESNHGESNFYGFDFSDRDFETSTFNCKSCSNRCEIKRVKLEGQSPLFYGSRCGRYDSSGKSGSPAKENGNGDRRELVNLFSYREKRFWLEGFERLDPHSVYHYPKNGRVPGEAPEGKVGIPRVLLFWKKFPFWSSLFRSLDYDVILSKPSDRSLIRESSQNATSETCLPAKITYGHINNLLAYDEESEQLDFLFLPALISNDHQGTETPTNYNCPLVQSLPYVSNGEFEFNRIDSSVEAITQSFHFYSEEILRSELMELGSKLGKSKSQVLKAYEKATKLEQVINSSFLEKGKQALEQLTDSHPGIVLLSRPYNGCDPGLNMDIPDKLRELGARPIPIDFLPVEEVSPDRLHPSMQWDWGKRILSAAKIIKDTPNLYAIYLSHFRCGPDSFIIRYVKEILKDEPFLHLELDEHSADAGILTRCEAFLDSLS